MKSTEKFLKLGFDRLITMIRVAAREVLNHIVLILVGIYIGWAMFSGTCEARTIYYGSEVENVTVEFGGDTIFRFNGPVKTITRAPKFQIEPSDEKNPDYAVLSVTPRFSKGSGNLTFILANGAVVNTKIRILSKGIPEKTDSFYDFLPKEDLIEKAANSGPDISDLELMKGMIRWDQIVGVKVKSLVRTVNTGMSGISANLLRVYTTGKYNGYVFKIRNTSRSKIMKIDVRSLYLGTPNQAILSQVDKEALSPKSATFLRIVAKPSSVYYNINLPIGTVSKK